MTTVDGNSNGSQSLLKLNNNLKPFILSHKDSWLHNRKCSGF